MSFPTLRVFGVLAAAVVGGVVACSSDDTSVSATYSTAAAVTGATDAHCGATVQSVEQSACTAAAAEGEADAGSDGATSDYGPALFNAEGDDDDCKYHVTWKSTPVSQNKDVSFVVSAVYKTDNKPVTGANVRAEVFLSDVHPAPNSGVSTKESSSGTYTIGPIHFDAPGQWTVRFHFFETCNDNEHSPHGHAAFLVNVP